jgi:hypothetical protein
MQIEVGDHGTVDSGWHLRSRWLAHDLHAGLFVYFEFVESGYVDGVARRKLGEKLETVSASAPSFGKIANQSR